MQRVTWQVHPMPADLVRETARSGILASTLR